MNQIKSQISETVQMSIDGELNALEMYAMLNDLKKHIELGMKEIKDAAFIEASRYGDKTFEDFGFKFTLSDGKTRYNFKGIKAWEEAKARLSQIEDAAKSSAQNKLKHGAFLVTEDGEVIEGAEITYTDASISITQKR